MTIFLIVSAILLVPAAIALFNASRHDRRGVTHLKEAQSWKLPK